MQQGDKQLGFAGALFPRLRRVSKSNTLALRCMFFFFLSLLFVVIFIYLFLSMRESASHDPCTTPAGSNKVADVLGLHRKRGTEQWNVEL